MDAMPFIGIIEKGIPLPHSKRGDGSLRERMAALSVRDSFETDYSIAGVHQMSRKLAIKVETRKAGKGRIRVWRVE